MPHSIARDAEVTLHSDEIPRETHASNGSDFAKHCISLIQQHLSDRNADKIQARLLITLTLPIIMKSTQVMSPFSILHHSLRRGACFLITHARRKTVKPKPSTPCPGTPTY